MYSSHPPKKEVSLEIHFQLAALTFIDFLKPKEKKKVPFEVILFVAINWTRKLCWAEIVIPLFSKTSAFR